MTDIRKHNRDAWNRWADDYIEWSIPVDAQIIEKARAGDWRIFLTEMRAVPASWFPPIIGLKILCLASGGGQAGPGVGGGQARR